MPFRKITLAPGVNIERSATLNQTQFAASNLIRFYGGLIQKIGGWQAIATTALLGTCRALHGWADILGNTYLAAGTEQRLQVFIGGLIYDITPLVATDNPAVSFSTTISTNTVSITDGSYTPSIGDWIYLATEVAVGGLVLYGYYQVTGSVSSSVYQITAAGTATSTITNGGAVASFTTTNGVATVSVLLAAHGLAVGAIYNVDVAVVVGGLTLSGAYNVTSVTDSSHFVITAAGVASSGATAAQNSGNAQIKYLLPTGYSTTTYLAGWGVGDYGSGDWGLSNSASQSVGLRQWSLDHWGQDLIASPSNGKIYYWQPPSIAPSVVVSGAAPVANTLVFVQPQVQIIIACGAEISGTQQPTLIRWCDAGDFTAWNASTTNQAGSYSLPTGSKIVAGLPVSMGALIWTDVDLWTMSYQNLPYVFGFNRIATSCGIVSQRAAAVVGADVRWLSTRGFYSYGPSAGVSALECPVLDFYLNNFDISQADQVHAAVNALFNEVTWHFPLLTTSPLYVANSVQMAYLKWNYAENVWDFGVSSQYQRTAWVGRSVVGNPIGADLAGLLQQHEIGYDANGSPMAWSWQTGFFDIADGEQYVFVDLIIPDFITTGTPSITINILVTNYPGDTPTSYGPYTVTPTTEFVPVRVRGRQMAVAASGADLGTFNRIGAIRIRFAPDGRN